MPLIRLEEAASGAATSARQGSRFALFALGFRPFYLLAALWAALAVPLWLAQFRGVLAPTGALPPLYWHAHEMLFGFAAAVIVGFLFTAGRNWTGLATPNGRPLAAMALLWVLGRITLLTGPTWLAIALDALFLPWAAIALGRVLLQARSRRNYFTAVILLALATCNLVFHLRVAGVLGGDPMQLLHAALALVILLATVIAGRIVPSFTRNALGPVRQFLRPALDRAAIAATALGLVLWVSGGAAAIAAGVLLIAAILQTIRSIGWAPWPSRRVSLLWSLHAGHAWVPVGLALAACAQLGLLPASLAWHALALGAVGGLILAMITRTALGHTGRPLRAGRRETTAYVLLHAAVVLRVFGPLLLPGLSMAWLGLAMSAWSGAFLLYLLTYAPMLWRPRLDGKPG